MYERKILGMLAKLMDVCATLGAGTNIPNILTYFNIGSRYQGLNRTDPHAVWSYQGWQIRNWKTASEGAFVKAFVDATPPGKFVIIDMDEQGQGQWHQWGNASFFGANFIWTAVHDFGGTDGMKGDLALINQIPFGAMRPASRQGTGVWGTGLTPEGIDQNPVFYEFMLETNFRTAPVGNITKHIDARSQRRYFGGKCTTGSTGPTGPTGPTGAGKAADAIQWAAGTAVATSAACETAGALLSEAWALLVDSTYGSSMPGKIGSVGGGCLFVCSMSIPPIIQKLSC